MNVLALVLAGGSGTRFGALTAWRAKPALPFAGQFRAIDFTLSNCINSGFRQIALLTQYKSPSLIRHVHAGWGFLHRELGEFVDIWPAQQQLGERWYCGNVDAVHQNLDLVAAADPDLVLILSGTQIYAMDYSLLIEQHVARGAAVTIGTVEASVDDFSEHAMVAVDGAAHVQRVTASAADLRGKLDGTIARAVMGVYLFDARDLCDCVLADAADPCSRHDFAADLLPNAAAGSVLLPGVRIGRGCALDHVVIDRGCELPDHSIIGRSAPVGPSSYALSPHGVVLISEAHGGHPERAAPAKVA